MHTVSLYRLYPFPQLTVVRASTQLSCPLHREQVCRAAPQADIAPNDVLCDAFGQPFPATRRHIVLSLVSSTTSSRHWYILRRIAIVDIVD
jgi:hypothetical protein